MEPGLRELAIFLIIFFCVAVCPAQEKSDSLIYEIETKDGNSYLGKILQQDSSMVLFEVENLGKIRIPISNIKQINQIDSSRIKSGKFWFENPQSTRYFYSPNGYSLKPGEGYYQNVWVLFNSFSIGITNSISIGLGVLPLFLFGSPSPFWITPKVSIPVTRDKFNIGAGALAGSILFEEEKGFGILYGITTFGSRDNNVSIGLGYGYVGDEWSKHPMVNISIMLRTGANGYFLSENYFISTSESTSLIISLGGRQLIKKVSLDYGLLIPVNESFIITIPWLGIAVPFGRNK